MNKKIKQSMVILASLVVTLGLLLGGQAVARWGTVAHPLDQAFRQDHHVVSFTLEQNTTPPTVDIKLGRVQNLEQAGQRLFNEADLVFGAGNYVLNVSGNPDAKLTNLANGLSFVIAQGLATGQYVTMEQAVQRAAKAQHVTADLYLDSNNLYLALYDGAHDQYEILPRDASLQNGGLPLGQGGSGS